jgi:hypothetical protein
VLTEHKFQEHFYTTKKKQEQVGDDFITRSFKICILRLTFLEWLNKGKWGFEVLTAVVMKISVFCDIIMCSLLEVNFLHTSFLLGFFFDPEMKFICSLETSVEFQRTTLHYMPELFKGYCDWQNM